MIRSANAIASEIADSDAGEFMPSHCVNFLVARMQAAMRITRFLPSSTNMSLAYSPFIRYNWMRLFISDFGICTAGSQRSGGRWLGEVGEGKGSAAQSGVRKFSELVGKVKDTSPHPGANDSPKERPRIDLNAKLGTTLFCIHCLFRVLIGWVPTTLERYRREVKSGYGVFCNSLAHR